MGKRKPAVSKHDSEEVDDPEAEASGDSLNQSAESKLKKPPAKRQRKVASPKPKASPKPTATKTKAKAKAKEPSDDEKEEDEEEEEEEENEEDVENEEEDEDVDDEEEEEEDEDEDEDEDDSEEESGEEGGKKAKKKDKKPKKFPSGTFVAAKADLENGGAIINKTACIWQVDDSTLLQKFAPQEDDKGNIVYSATPVYTGWGVRKRSDYEEVQVKPEPGSGKQSKKVTLVVQAAAE